MFKTIFFVCVMLFSAVHSTVAFAGPKFKARANLVGDTVMKGKVHVQEKHGSLRLDVHVLRAGAFATYDVWVNDDIVGQIFTNPGGSGRLRINRPLQSMHVGDVISVGPVSGTLGGQGGGGGGGGGNIATLDLVGAAITAEGVRSVVEYREVLRNGAWDQTLIVNIEDGEPFQSVPVFVNGVFLAPMYPGADGRAELRMRSAAFIDDPAVWQPLPNDFPRLQNGAQVQVGTAYVALHPVP